MGRVSAGIHPHRDSPVVIPMAAAYVPDNLLVVKIAASAYWNIVTSIGSRPPEHGGLLLGPTESDHISEFWFDSQAQQSCTTYSPDTVKMNLLLREEWRPRGLDWKGIVHSHPSGFEELTRGDRAYIERLLTGNGDMKRFVAPIVLPEAFTIRTFVVLPGRPSLALPAKLELLM